MHVVAGQKVRVLKKVIARDGFFKRKEADPSKTKVTIPKGTVAPAAIDEIGGTILIDMTMPGGEGIYVPLGPGEFAGV